MVQGGDPQVQAEVVPAMFGIETKAGVSPHKLIARYAFHGECGSEYERQP